MIQLQGEAYARLSKYVSRDDDRYFMRHVHVERDALVATDGRAMYVVQNDREVPAGEYTVVKATTKEIVLEPDKDSGQFPYWRKVIADPAKYRFVETCSRNRIVGVVGVAGSIISPEYVKPVGERNEVNVFVWAPPLEAKEHPKPVVIAEQGDAKWFLLVMPMMLETGGQVEPKLLPKFVESARTTPERDSAKATA